MPADSHEEERVADDHVQGKKGSMEKIKNAGSLMETEQGGN